MTSIVKVSKHKWQRLKRHHPGQAGRPICGAGRGVVAWQTDMGEPNCQRCQSIFSRKKK